MPEAFKVLVKELKGLCLNVNLYKKDGGRIDLDELTKQALIEEKKVNSSIRNAMSPKEEEVDPTATVEVATDLVAEEGFSVSDKLPGSEE